MNTGDNSKYIVNALLQSQKALDALMSDDSCVGAIHKAGELMGDCLEHGSRIFACGNGGSLCDAMHFAEELTGRYRKNRRPFAAEAISDVSHMACVSNDFGYEDVFARWIIAHGHERDLLLAISTSGRSKNVIKAAMCAKEKGMTVVALTGAKVCELGKWADVHVACPSFEWADRVQELHIKIIHIWIELIERRLCPENYV